MGPAKSEWKRAPQADISSGRRGYNEIRFASNGPHIYSYVCFRFSPNAKCSIYNCTTYPDVRTKDGYNAHHPNKTTLLISPVPYSILPSSRKARQVDAQPPRQAVRGLNSHRVSSVRFALFDAALLRGAPPVSAQARRQFSHRAVFSQAAFKAFCH